EEVRGELGKVGVSDLMQTIASGKRTGFARVLQGKTRDVERTAHTESLHQDDEVGQFFFENGELIDAEVGRLRGESAMYRMMRWTQGRYRLKTMPQVRRRRRIRHAMNEVLAEGLERAERFDELYKQLPGLDEVYEVDLSSLANEVDDIPDEVRAMLRLFDGVRTLERIVLESRMGDLEALRVVERLHKRRQRMHAELGSDR